MGTLYEDQCTFLIISCLLVLRIRNISDKIVEKIKTHILCSITFFFRKLCRLWNNEEKCAEQATEDNVAHAHCIPDT